MRARGRKRGNKKEGGLASRGIFKAEMFVLCVKKEERRGLKSQAKNKWPMLNVIAFSSILDIKKPLNLARIGKKK